MKLLILGDVIVDGFIAQTFFLPSCLCFQFCGVYSLPS